MILTPKGHGASATDKILFELNFGRHPWKGDLIVQTGIPQVEEFMKHLQNVKIADDGLNFYFLICFIFFFFFYI